jgi:Mu-like prophage I protein
MYLNLSEVADGLVRIAVAYTGSFSQEGRAFEITSQDLQQMRRNLAGRETPIDYEHLSGGPAPPGWTRAAGWIKRADHIESFGDGRQVLWVWAELTPALLAAVQQKEFRYFSPEIQWKARDEKGNLIGTRLASGAITNRPFLKELPPIEILDSDYPELLEAVALSELHRLKAAPDLHIHAPSSPIPDDVKTFKLRRLVKAGKHTDKIGVFDEGNMVGLAEYDGMGPIWSSPPGQAVNCTQNGGKVKQTFKERFFDSQRLSEGSFERMTLDETIDHAVTCLMREEKLDRMKALSLFGRLFPEMWEEHKAQFYQGRSVE